MLNIGTWFKILYSTGWPIQLHPWATSLQPLLLFLLSITQISLKEILCFMWSLGKCIHLVLYSVIARRKRELGQGERGEEGWVGNSLMGGKYHRGGGRSTKDKSSLFFMLESIWTGLTYLTSKTCRANTELDITWQNHLLQIDVPVFVEPACTVHKC